MLKHYILMRYKPGTEEAHIEAFCQKMYALRDVIPEIRHLEIGRDILREARSWDLMLDMRFDSVETLRCYQIHEAHQAALQFNNPQVLEVAAFDYETPVAVKLAD